MDNPEGIACSTANGTSHLTFDRRRWVISCGSKFMLIYVTALIEIKYTETDKIGYSRFISRLGESKMMSREHND